MLNLLDPRWYLDHSSLLHISSWARQRIPFEIYIEHITDISAITETGLKENIPQSEMLQLRRQESERAPLLPITTSSDNAGASEAGTEHMDDLDIIGSAFGLFNFLPEISTLKAQGIGRHFICHQAEAERYLHMHLDTLDKIAAENVSDQPLDDDEEDCLPNLMARLMYSRDSAISDLIRMEKIFIHGRSVYETRPCAPTCLREATFW